MLGAEAEGVGEGEEGVGEGERVGSDGEGDAGEGEGEAGVGVEVLAWWEQALISISPPKENMARRPMNVFSIPPDTVLTADAVSVSRECGEHHSTPRATVRTPRHSLRASQ